MFSQHCFARFFFATLLRSLILWRNIASLVFSLGATLLRLLICFARFFLQLCFACCLLVLRSKVNMALGVNVRMERSSIAPFLFYLHFPSEGFGYGWEDDLAIDDVQAFL